MRGSVVIRPRPCMTLVYPPPPSRVSLSKIKLPRQNPYLVSPPTSTIPSLFRTALSFSAHIGTSKWSISPQNRSAALQGLGPPIMGKYFGAPRTDFLGRKYAFYSVARSKESTGRPLRMLPGFFREFSWSSFFVSSDSLLDCSSMLPVPGT